MAEYTINKFTYNGNTYKLKDAVSGYTTNSGTITKIQTSAGTHSAINVSNGAVSFNVPTKTSHLTNDAGFITSADVPEGSTAYAGTISAVGTTASTGTNNGFARGDHVHNITSSTIISALGYTPYNSTNPSGYTSNAGTITGVTGGTGLSGSGTSGTITINHSNSVTAQTTQAVYPIKIDAQGHISAYGTAVTIPTIPSNNITGSGTSGYLTKFNGSNTITNGPAFSSSGTRFLKEDGTWATPTGSGGGGGVTMSMLTVSLTVAGWNDYSQTVAATGVTASNAVIVTPAPESTEDYVDAGILCTAQASGSLTFQCSTVPENAVSVNVLILT